MSEFEHNSETMVEAVASTGKRVHSRKTPGGGFAVALFAVFIVIDLLALVMGVSSYQSVNDMQQQTDQRMLLMGPIRSAIRANDTKDGVGVGKGPEGKSLVLLQHVGSDTYETRIYKYQGNVVEEYSLGGNPYTPERATVLAPSSSFDFSYDGGLLSVTTDAGTVHVALHTAKGGA